MTGPQGQVFTSTDLANWTKRTTPDTDDITEISYGNSVFVLRKYWQAGNMLRSADGGITWATVATGSVPGDARNYQEVEFGNGKFLYALDNSVRSSTDGATWTEHSVTVPSGFTFTKGKIHFDGVRFVSSAETAVNGNERTMTTGTSTDGIIWTFKSSIVNSPRPLGLGTVTDKLVVISSSDVSGTNLFVSSDDGESWIDYSTPWSAKNVYGWAFGAGVVVVATSDGLYKGVPQSPDNTDVNLNMVVSPTEGGTTEPAVGIKFVKKDETFAITATPASGYSFVRWTATPSSNASIASPSSQDTTVTLTGDATVTAIFTSTGGSGSLANSKVKIIIDSSKQYKDSISIVKGKLPTGFVKPVEGDPLIIQVDAWTLSVNGGYKASGDKITYKGETVVKIKGHASSFAKASHFAQEATRDRPADMKAVNSNVKTHAKAVNSNGGTKTAEKSVKGNKYQLVLDLKKLEWNLRISNADLSTGSPLDSFDGLDVMLSVNGTPIGQNIGTDDLVKWRFTSTKNSSEKLALGGQEWLNFAVNKADGSNIGDKPSRDSFTVGNGTGDIITFDSATDSVTVLIDKFKLALNDADEGSAWKSGNGRHIFKGTFAGVTVVQFVIDLSKNSASWKFKVSKADFWDDIDGSDGLDFRVIIGNYQGGLRLDADQTTTMSYPQK